jgi:inosose dehydratase
MKLLGGRNLQITDGGHPGVNYSAGEIKALGTRMNGLGKIAADSGLVLGYHPHFGTLGETRKGLGRVLDATNPKYVRLIADVGHLTLGGSDPAEVIRTYHDRLIFLHFKDVRKDVLAQARKSRNLVRKTRYLFCEIDQGGVNFPAILQALRDIKFDGWVIIELDAYHVRPGGPAASARMNRDAMRQMGFKV